MSRNLPPSGPDRRVHGRHLAAPRPTLWVPLLLAVLLSLPVALASLVVAVLP